MLDRLWGVLVHLDRVRDRFLEILVTDITLYSSYPHLETLTTPVVNTMSHFTAKNLPRWEHIGSSFFDRI